MQTHDSNNQENQQQNTNETVQKKPIRQKKSKQKSSLDSTQNWQEIANNSPQAIAQRQQMNRWHNSPRMVAQRQRMETINNSPLMVAQRQAIENNKQLQLKAIQKKSTNKTGLPDDLKSGMESMTGVDLGDTKVHYNSNKPAQLNAHAYAQGTDIHLGAGQEQHLGHELAHVVQQKQGRVQPTTLY